MRQALRSSKIVRRGSVAPLLIFSLTTLLACFAFAVNKTWLWSVREDIKLATDSAALAAAGTLADDDLIRHNPALYPDLLSRASAAAINFAAINPVRRHPVVLIDNIDNLTNGDIVFGVVSTPRAGDFVPAPSRQVADPNQGRTNTVVVLGQQSQSRGTAVGLIFGVFAGHAYADVTATSAATLDGGIRGVRPLSKPTPLSPFALLSDTSATNPLSWESGVEAGTGPDQQRYDAANKAFVADPAGDGIHEFNAMLATDPSQAAGANVALVYLGSNDVSQLASSLVNGVTGDDLASFGRQFVLPDSGIQAFDGQNAGPAGDSPDAQAIYDALEALRQSADVRIWPLYSSATSSQVTVSGFVAARVVSVTPPQANQPLQFTLQATVIARPDLVTDTDLRGSAATMNGNRYVYKIRRIE